MKIHMVCLEDGITATGFRKMSAWVERIEPETKVFYVGTHRARSIWKSITRTFGDIQEFDSAGIDSIARGLAGADIIGFSSMTGYSALTSSVIARVREVSPNSFLIWGGIHPIIHPEDAIQAEVDAICVGEGEFAFEELVGHLRAGTDYRSTKNFWFKKNGEITRNGFRPLMTPAELDTLPYSKYGGDEWIYRSGKGFTPVSRGDYLANDGLGYSAVWSIGCPLHCSFCGNTVFIANDPKYAKVRHPSPDWMIGEVLQARKIHPHLSTVLFHDDSFMAVSLRDLTDFATQWKEKVGISFCVYGVIPTYVQRDKMELLTWAGMNRVRMGVQSGSERILKFYRRPVPVAKVEQAASIIAEFSRYQINPAYDIIVDNPLETRQDVVDTLELLYRLARPYTCNVFSLRVIPNTFLEKQMRENGIDLEQINENYIAVRPSFANTLLYLVLLWRMPRWIFDRMLKRVRAFNEPQASHRLLLLVVRSAWFFKQGLRHLRFAEFSAITGYSGYVVWRIGLLWLWRKLFTRKLDKPSGGWDRHVSEGLNRSEVALESGDI